jgi:hypothetical protein
MLVAAAAAAAAAQSKAEAFPPATAGIELASNCVQLHLTIHGTACSNTTQTHTQQAAAGQTNVDANILPTCYE